MKIRSLVIHKSPETTFLSELSVLIKCTKIDAVSDAKKLIPSQKYKSLKFKICKSTNIMYFLLLERNICAKFIIYSRAFACGYENVTLT